MKGSFARPKNKKIDVEIIRIGIFKLEFLVFFY